MKVLTITLSVLLALALAGLGFEINEINGSNGYLSQVHALETDKTSLQNQLSIANSQISILQNIVNTEETKTIISNDTINQSAGESTNLATFNAQYIGYVRISGTSSTTNGYIVVNGSQYQFGTQNTLTIPILSGYISISFGNTNFINDASATLNIDYVY
jgi:non-ribosomal peptide synthetase component E (peptide arylation enzyme)